MTSLSDKLKALGVQVGARDLSAAHPRTAHPIEQVVAGQFCETPGGTTFLVEERYPLDHRHGKAALGNAASLRTIAEWADDPRIAEAAPDSLAFLDTETTGLSGGTGTYAFLVGIGRFDGQTFRLAQFFMRDPAEEPALLAAVGAFLQPCAALVTFNGKGFDVPLLNTRFIANGERSPLPTLAHLDLLPLARRLWRDRLPSRTLGYLEEHILGVTRAGEDVPGWAIPGLYFDYVRTRDARPLRNVFYHNAMDVLSLVTLLGHTAALLADPLDGVVAHGLDVVAMGKLFEALRRLEMAEELYKRGLSRPLPEGARRDALRRLSFTHKRLGNLAEAVVLWRESAHQGEVYAYVELAKFFEHRQGDFFEAAQWTEMAIARVGEANFTPYERQRWLPELKHRLARLHRKLQASMERAEEDASAAPRR